MVEGSIQDPPPGQHLPFRHVAGPPPPPHGPTQVPYRPGAPCHRCVSPHLARPSLTCCGCVLATQLCVEVHVVDGPKAPRGRMRRDRLDEKTRRKRFSAGFQGGSSRGESERKGGEKTKKKRFRGGRQRVPGREKRSEMNLRSGFRKGKRSVFDRDVGTKIASKNGIRGQKGEKVT